MRSQCARAEPAVPTLDAVAARMATVPGRRKALVFLSVGVPLTFMGNGSCASQLTDVMRGVFRTAQRANLNIHAIDPAGLNGYRDYLAVRARRTPENGFGMRRRATNLRQLEDFMKTIASTTGGRAVIATNAIEAAVDQILEEDRTYYLIGYESTNGAPDGKFRKVDIRVNRPGVSVRSRGGYWAPRADEVVARPTAESPNSSAVSMTGLIGPQGLPLRAVVSPFSRSNAAPGNRNVDVGMVVSVKFPPLRAPVDETLTTIRNVYDAAGRPGPPVRETVTVRLEPNGGDSVRHEFFQRLSLPPGRYQVRFNTHSAVLGASGSVYADLDVPDLTRPGLSLSSVVIGHATEEVRDDVLASLVPVVPTSERAFSANDALTAALRIYQGGTTAPAPVTVVSEIFDAADMRQQDFTSTVAAEDFDDGRGATHEWNLPIAGLKPGPYLLSITAQLPGGRSTRQDVLFRIR